MRALTLLLLFGLLVACSSLSEIAELEQAGKLNAAWEKAMSFVEAGDENSAEAIPLAARLGVSLDKQKETGARFLKTLNQAPDLAETLGQGWATLGEEAVRALVKAYEKAQAKPPYERALLATGSIGSGQLAQGLNRLVWKSKKQRIALLARYHSEEAALGLIPHLGGDASDAVEEAMLALRQYSFKALETALQQNKLSTRQKAASARVLGEIKNREALPLLENLASDPDPAVRSAAEKSLALIRGF